MDKDTSTFMKDMIVSLLDVETDNPEYPEFNEWSELVPLSLQGKSIPTDYIRSGVYKIHHHDEVIYIGETRCDGTVVSRKGMWSRRGDFRSTAQANGKVKNPYGNALKFLEVYGIEEMDNVSHSFHYVHPKYCKEAELELLTTYYNEHNTLPMLQTEIDYKRVLKVKSIKV